MLTGGLLCLQGAAAGDPVEFAGAGAATAAVAEAAAEAAGKAVAVGWCCRSSKELKC